MKLYCDSFSFNYLLRLRFTPTCYSYKENAENETRMSVQSQGKSESHCQSIMEPTTRRKKNNNHKKAQLSNFYVRSPTIQPSKRKLNFKTSPPGSYINATTLPPKNHLFEFSITIVRRETKLFL